MNERKEHPMTAVPDALSIVLQETARRFLSKPRQTIQIPITNWDQLINQILIEPVYMQEPGYPNYRASIMDGFAIRVHEFESSNGGEWTHAVLDKVFAGDGVAPKQSVSDQNLPPAYYATTGAVVPDTFDCVVPIEECRLSDDQSKIAIQSTAIIQDQKWIRPVGCDIAPGSVVLPAGHVLDAVAMGLLRQAGCQYVTVSARPTVGVLSTGNELLQDSNSSTPTPIGSIPDVNRPILLSLFSAFDNCHAIDLGMVGDDDIDAMTNAIQAAMKSCDVIITTGGISMGETDIVEQVLVERLQGQLHYGRMHMKPGKPTTFVTISPNQKTCLIFAMPGNPVSATVCTQLLVKPCLDLLVEGPDQSADTYGDSVDEQVRRIVSNAWVHPEIQGKLAHDIKLDPQRPEYHRVALKYRPDGSCLVSSTGVQRSSRLMSLRDAEGLVCLPQASPGKTKALAGETYTVLLLREPKSRRVQVFNSLHLNKAKSRHKSTNVGIVQVNAPNQDTDERVKKALSGSKSGTASIISSRVYSTECAQSLFDYCTEEENADILVVTCPTLTGCFRKHIELANDLRNKLDKVADAMALQARRGAAAQEQTTVLFEVVVGFVPKGKGSLLIFVPLEGLDGALGNVRGLLKHALQIARGTVHHH